MLIMDTNDRLSQDYDRYNFDILETIFVRLAPPASCAVQRRAERDRRKGFPKLHKDIATVSRVCKTWRGYALKCRNLWASITIPGARLPLALMVDEPWWTWAEVLMKRSGEAPLFVCLDLGYVGEARHCDVIRDCLSRVKGLCIHGSGLSESRILDILKSHGAPKLEMLSLDLTNADSKLVRCKFQPGDLFRNNAPQLKQLKVKPGIAVLPSVPLSRLTRFTVLHRGNERTWTSTNRCYVYDLHQELCSMTSLEVLEIETDSRNRLDWEGRKKIQFRHLREIVIKDSLHNCRQILAKTVVPAGCTAEIVIFRERDVVGNDITDELARHWMISMGIGYVNGRVPEADVHRTEEGQVLRMRVPGVSNL